MKKIKANKMIKYTVLHVLQHLHRSLTHFPITVGNRPITILAAVDAQTRRLGMNDMMAGAISNWRRAELSRAKKRGAEQSSGEQSRANRAEPS